MAVREEIDQLIADVDSGRNETLRNYARLMCHGHVPLQLTGQRATLVGETIRLLFLSRLTEQFEKKSLSVARAALGLLLPPWLSRLRKRSS